MIHAVKTVRERIRWILESQKLSESALSKKAGLTRSHVGRYLSDRIHHLGDETLAAIALAAHVRVEWLRDGIGDPLDTQRGMDHGSLLDALTTAFRRHPDATLDDLDAVRRLLQGDAAPRLPMEHAAIILASWLSAARVLRLRGESVSWDVLAVYLSNPTPDPAASAASRGRN